MNPKYRFFLQINDGEKIPVSPIYSDDMTLDYEMESNQRFYRTKLSGKFNFVGSDFMTIMSALFDDIYYFYIEKSNDWGNTWNEYYKATFMRTDCTINQDDQVVTVQPQPIDQYNDILAGLEKEYNLITLAPEIVPITLAKRPLIQIYVYGESKVSCFLNGLTWEQDCDVITSTSELEQTYYFAQIKSLSKNSLYSPNNDPTMTPFLGEYISDDNITYRGANGYYVYEGTGIIRNVKLYDNNNNLILTGYTTGIYDRWRYGDKIETALAQPQNITLFGRYLLDTDTILGLSTYALPANDMVGNNRNYRRAIGYAIEDTIALTFNYSDSPTEYGLAPNGKYYRPPYSIFGQKFYPIGRSKWSDFSIWFNFYAFDSVAEESGRKSYVLRDCYPVSSAISVLLKQFAPQIKHEPTPEYSEFLYGENNPLSYISFRLFVTPKSNILVGEYQTPAQKSLTTLQQFLDMLRNTFQLYWHIEDNKLRIEHIEWYRNGGAYYGNPAIGYDLTKLKNVRNGKEWAFATSEYKFDKEDMPERYQFAWMDDVTDVFDGQPIQVLSKYVQAGKIEEINIGGFTSDIDYMLLNPEAINQDGFALFAAVNDNGIYKLPFVREDIDNNTYYNQNGYLAMTYLQPAFWLYNMPARNLLVNGDEMWAYGLQRRKSQDITFPVGDNDPDVMELVKTNLGNGEIQKISINLSSRTAKATLKYDTE